MTVAVPAFIPASHEDLEGKVSLLSALPGVEAIQIDVVDGKFAEPASWPYTAPGEIGALAERGEMLPHLDRIRYEIDLMCLDPERAAGQWLALGATRLTFHAESVTDLSRLLAFVSRQYGSGADFTAELASFGIALNLGSDLDLIEPCLSSVEYVQFMGIARIGKQGEPFDERVFEKIRVFHERHPEFPIQVDGGVSLGNAKKLLSLGVERLIVGSAITRAHDPAAAFTEFENLKSAYEG